MARLDPLQGVRQSQRTNEELSETSASQSTTAEPHLVPYSTEVITASVQGQHDPNSSKRQVIGKLPLLQLDEWNPNRTYDEIPPTCIHYSIEWRLIVNSKAVVRETEQDIVLAPSSFWRLVLQPKFDKLLSKKLSLKRTLEADDTGIVVSVNDRSERDLTKHFDGLDINWSVVETQLRSWGELFRCGKKLRVEISFNYMETDQLTTTGDRKRTKISATKSMLSEMALQLEAEKGSSGQPSIWRDVYNLMRCTGPPCSLGPYCWRDPVGHKHYSLKTHHLRSLIRHVEQGNELLNHEDVPQMIRQQLYDEDQQRKERQPKRGTSVSGFPHISITNVLPDQSSQPSTTSSPSTLAPSKTLPIERSICLDVPGLRDIAVKRYCAWQQSKVADQEFKMDFQKAGEFTLVEGLDLEQVFADQHPDFYVEKGIRRGIARRFVSDIEAWVKDERENNA